MAELKLSPRDFQVLELLQKQWASVNDIKEHCHTTEGRKAVSNLKKAGIQIEDRWMYYIGSNGSTTKYKEYRVVEG